MEETLTYDDVILEMRLAGMQENIEELLDLIDIYGFVAVRYSPYGVLIQLDNLYERLNNVLDKIPTPSKPLCALQELDPELEIYRQVIGYSTKGEHLRPSLIWRIVYTEIMKKRIRNFVGRVRLLELQYDNVKII